MTIPLLSIVVFAPLVAAVLLIFVPSTARVAVRGISILSTLVSLVGSLFVACAYDLEAGGYQMHESYPVVPELGIHLSLAVDGWGVSLLLLLSLIHI